jgi:Diacylglycerol kinase catalytic domain
MQEGDALQGVCSLKEPMSRSPFTARQVHKHPAKVRVAVIENPASGFNRRHPGQLERQCESAGLHYRAGRSPEALRCCVHELLALEPEVLAVSGGDGTVSLILGILHESGVWPPPALALLKGGSTNLIHRELGLPGSPDLALEALRLAMEADAPAAVIWRAPIAVRSGGEQQIGFFFAVGAMQRVLRACQEISAWAGLRGRVLEFLGLTSNFVRVLARGGGMRADRIFWTSSEEASTSDWQGGDRLFVYLTSLNRLLFDFDPHGRRDALKLVGFKFPFGRPALVSYLATRGRPGKSDWPDVEHDSSDGYTLSFDGQWVLDGEFYGSHDERNIVNVSTGRQVPFLVLNIKEAREDLVALVAREAAQPASEAAAFWAGRLGALPGAAAVLFYGSGLRGGESRDPEVIHDFYVLVHRYRDFTPSRLLALGGTLVPPNVYYFEERLGDGWTRCKVAVLTTSQFCAEARDRAFTPHIWARFCQPTRVLFAASEEVLGRLHEALADCVLSFHRRALLLADSLPVADFWRVGLTSTYADEIRSDGRRQPSVIYAGSEEAFRERTCAALRLLPELGWIDGAGVVHSRLSPGRRPLHGWRLRMGRPLRKAVVALRLSKAAFTFQNGLEYAQWKVERHSGRRFEISAFEKRHPVWGGLILFLRAVRQGALR